MNEGHLFIYLFIISTFLLYHTGAHSQHDTGYKPTAFHFNGETDFLVLESNPSVEFFHATQHFTVEIQFYLEAIDRQQALVEKYGCTGG
jgi:hypothetical protein